MTEALLGSFTRISALARPALIQRGRALVSVLHAAVGGVAVGGGVGQLDANQRAAGGGLGQGVVRACDAEGGGVSGGGRGLWGLLRVGKRGEGGQGGGEWAKEEGYGRRRRGVGKGGGE